MLIGTSYGLHGNTENPSASPVCTKVISRAVIFDSRYLSRIKSSWVGIIGYLYVWT